MSVEKMELTAVVKLGEFVLSKGTVCQYTKCLMESLLTTHIMEEVSFYRHLIYNSSVFITNKILKVAKKQNSVT